MAVEAGSAERLTWQIPNWIQGLAALVLVIGALALLGLGLVRTSSPLVVEVDGRRHNLNTHATTVGAALRRAGLELHSEDLVTPGLETRLQPGTVVQIKRARAVTLKADGQIHQIRTQAETVGQVLTEVGLQLGPADEIWSGTQLVGPHTPLSGSISAPGKVSDRGGGREVAQANGSGEGLGPKAGHADVPLVLALRRAASLTLDDDGVTTTIHTTLSTVGQLLQAHHVSLFLGDQVTPGLQDRIVAGMVLKIHRSVPVKIDVDGRIIRTRTRAEGVAGVLGQEGIALVGKDRVIPEMGAPIRAGLTIRVTRVREEYVVEYDSIPFKTVWVPDPDVEIDNIRLVQAGQIGLTKHRFRVVYENGQEVDRYLEDSWAAQPPITKTMAYGTKIVIRTMETPDGPIEYWRKIRAYTVSYKPASCGKPKDHPRYGYTRLGWKLKKGIVAVDPNVIPLMTHMYVPGYGLARAGDTGGGVKGKLVDLGFSDDDYESWHWWTDIYILTPVPPRNKILWVLPDYPRFPDRGRH